MAIYVHIDVDRYILTGSILERATVRSTNTLVVEHKFRNCAHFSHSFSCSIHSACCRTIFELALMEYLDSGVSVSNSSAYNSNNAGQCITIASYMFDCG